MGGNAEHGQPMAFQLSVLANRRDSVVNEEQLVTLYLQGNTSS